MRLSEECLHHAVVTLVVATTNIDGAASFLMQKLTLPLPKLKVHSRGPWGSYGAMHRSRQFLVCSMLKCL